MVRCGSLRKEIHFEPDRNQSTISVDRLSRILANSSFITNHFLDNVSSKVVRDSYKDYFLFCLNKYELNFYIKERANSCTLQFKYNNNNNNIYLLQLGCHPVAVVILHVYKI